MSGPLEGRIALVTGAASGIGQAIAARFVAEGARVIAADIEAEAETLAAAPLAPFRLDVAAEESVAALEAAIAARYGRLDCMVNAAGIGRDIPFLDTSPAMFDRIIAVNLRGSFLVGQAAARLMPDGGAIVNIASVAGMRGSIGRAAYGASKGGVVILSQVMAVDLAAANIRVNVIAPGPIETPLVAAMHDPAIRAAWTQAMPLRRYGTPEDVAGAAVFLCGDDAAFITGHVLAVDGGFLGTGLTSR